jgi:hypothetical protein
MVSRKRGMAIKTPVMGVPLDAIVRAPLDAIVRAPLDAAVRNPINLTQNLV